MEKTNNIHNVHKFMRDFDIPFTCNDPEKFAELGAKYCQVIDYHNTENLKMSKAFNIYNRLLGFEEKGIVDMNKTYDLIGNILHYIVDSILGVYNADVKAVYDNFNTEDINAIYPLNKSDIPNGDVYNFANNGKEFISVDMSKAAFYTMRYVNPIFFNYKETWYDFVLNCIETYAADLDPQLPADYIALLADYFNESRQARQVIFGKLNPKRINHIEKYIMGIVLANIKELVPDATPVKLCNDEIIFEYTDDLYNTLTDSSIEIIDSGIKLKVEAFKLAQVTITQTTEIATRTQNLAMIKQNIKGIDKYDIKCCPTNFRFPLNMFLTFRNNVICIDNYDDEFFTLEQNGFIYKLSGNLEFEII